MTAPMPKDNEVDEKVTPVAWQWLDTSNFRKNIPSAAIREHWNPLYSAATVAELRAEVERLRDALDSCREAGNKHVQRRCQMDDEIERLIGEKTAAERRVGELERACKPIIEKSIAISKKTSSVFTSDLRRLLAALTGAREK